MTTALSYALTLSGSLWKNSEMSKKTLLCVLSSLLSVISLFHYFGAILQLWKMWKAANDANDSCPEKCKLIVSGGMHLIIALWIDLLFICKFTSDICVCVSIHTGIYIYFKFFYLLFFNVYIFEFSFESAITSC